MITGALCHCNLLHWLHLPAIYPSKLWTSSQLQKTEEGATPGTHSLAS